MRNGGDDEIDIVGLVTGKRLEVYGLDDFSINKHFLEASLFGCEGVFLVEAFSGLKDGGEEFDFLVFLEELAELVADGFGRLRDDSFSGLRAMLDAEFRVKEAEEVIDLSDRSNGGFSAAA